MHVDSAAASWHHRLSSVRHPWQLWFELHSRGLPWWLPCRSATRVWVVATSTISRSTLKRAVAAQELNDTFERKRRGPKPALPAACEENLVTWIAATQRAMLSVQPWKVLEMANELNRSIRGNLRSVSDLTYGWYAHFLDRHSVLSKRASEPLSRARQGANKQAFLALFYSLCQPIIARNMTSAQVFNMDETSFASKHQSQAVVAVRGSFDVWTKMTEAPFHLSVVAAVSANGYVVPPLFNLPGKRLRRATLDGCSIVEAGVMTAEKGFVNANVFELWANHFADNIPHIPRPVLLICDGCSSHVGLTVLRRCEQRGVILRLLPPTQRISSNLSTSLFSVGTSVRCRRCFAVCCTDPKSSPSQRRKRLL